MAKRFNTSGISVGYRRDSSLITADSNYVQSLTAINDSYFVQIEPAEVVDIILDSSHPEYKSNEDIGKIKIRFIYAENKSSDSNLMWAIPINSCVVSYPVIGEVVQVINLIDKYFYMSILNYYNDINNNVLTDISKNQSDLNLDNNNINSYKKVLITSIPNSPNENFNKYKQSNFKNNFNKYKKVKFTEGDVIIYGRLGNLIKLGTNVDKNSPNIKIIVGQPDDGSNSPLYTEDINKNKNSIWITTDEEVNLSPATKDSVAYLKSAESVPNKFDGNQIIINTDRIIWNASKNEIFLFAKKGIALSSNSYIAIDSVSNLGLTTQKKINIFSKDGVFINSSKILLGENANEPLVLGNKLVQILNELIDAIMNETHSTGSGPSGPPLNKAQFQSIKNKLSRMILSKQNKTS